ncbi:MAG: hypothetical protein ACOYUZ_03180 [Patescibacteria group bacterium]
MSFPVIFDSVMSVVLAFAWPLFILVLIFSAGMLWVIKPWRMSYAAAAVVNVPLVTLYMLSFLFALVPVIMDARNADSVPVWFNPLFIIMAVVLIAPVGYALLRMIDKDRERAPKHPLLHKILNFIGLTLFVGFVFCGAFASFLKPINISLDSVFAYLTYLFVFILGLSLFARMVVGGLYMTLGRHDPYIKVIDPYVKWIYVVMVGSTILALFFLLIDNLAQII